MTKEKEGAVRLVYYAQPQGSLPVKTPEEDRDLSLTQAVKVAQTIKFPKDGLRVDLEQVIHGHWSLVARRVKGGKLEMLP